MPINPIEATKTIKTDYLSYLESILTVKDDLLTKKAYNALRENEFVKGPFLEATPPFKTGVTIRELMDKGVLSAEFANNKNSINLERPLYIHQEEAIKKIISKRKNVIVATGTGSGKTECFLYPVINELMLQKERNKLTPGVRALLLYPMNALANDQINRLRELLKEYPYITFGRYTGETIEDESKAISKYRQKKFEEMSAKKLIKDRDYYDNDLNPLPNELISRETMRETPPNILLTNYAMLEYLLIRPLDTTFFDGDLAREWQFIVLDEAHIYKGANGTEIALLLRRLKERVCKNKKKKIQCIATSATLGNKEGLPELAVFATDIFAESFAENDIVTAKRKKRENEKILKIHNMPEYKKLYNEAKSMDKNEEAEVFVYEQLKNDIRIVRALKLLENKSGNLIDIAKIVFSDYHGKNEQIEGMIMLIELGVMAKPNPQSLSLLPARYHLFIRALEGVYISLYPEKQIYLDRRELAIISDDITVPVFELANCQDCGQEYIIGKDDNGFLKPHVEGEKIEYYMLTNDLSDNNEVNINDDDEVFEAAAVKKVKPYELCAVCGRLSCAGIRKREECCNITGDKKIIKVLKLQTKKSVINTCASCGGVSSGKIKRFMTANQPATYIIANSLYTLIPPKKVELPKLPLSNTENPFFDFDDIPKHNPEYYDETGRKLLVFSDNRQEAAFFAAYMKNKYNLLMWRRLILKELKMKSESIYIGDLIKKLVSKANDYVLYSDNMTNQDKEIFAGTYLIKEFIGHERKQGLEGRGYIKFFPDKTNIKSGQWGLTASELWDLCCMIMDTLRYSGAVTFPENINPEDENFAPKNRNVFFRKAESGKYKGDRILSFLPVGHANNTRLDYINKIIVAMGCDKDKAREKGLEILSVIYDHIILPLINKSYFTQNIIGKEGSVYKINYNKWLISYYNDDDILYRCNRCGKNVQYNIKMICPQFRCQGRLEIITAKDYRNDPYYSNMYNKEKLIPMISKEHTGQLNRDAAGSIQAKFEIGEINILSCTTTFELGVDVGELEAILLRNVPPETSNYIQRAGRAGRRTSSTAFSVTYARRSSHDLNYFNNPAEIINGKIKSPYIELSNDKIASRHVNSIVMAWFFRRDEVCKEYFKGNVMALVGADGRETIIDALNKELEKKPKDLIESIERVLNPQLIERLGIRKWAFVERLIGENGSLTNAINNKRKDLEELNDLYDTRTRKKLKSNDLLRLINTFEKEPTINFLASTGVIPKYGFPIDVVKLDVLSNASEAKEVDLTRDLKMAISEYAPGSEVIAAGKVWKSHCMNKVRDKEWPAYNYYDCSYCGRNTFPHGITTIENMDEESCSSMSCVCGRQMKNKKVVIPIFGFSTLWTEKANKVGETRPKAFYPTKVQFGGYEELDIYQEAERRETELEIGNKRVKANYSPQGKLVVMNKGLTGAGLFICKYCGYAKSFPEDFSHKNKYGHNCPNKHYTNAAFGHIFASDVLRLFFPEKYVKQYKTKNQWVTLLFAILEGSSDALGISRDDINGCLDSSESYPVIILFDEAPGGAGHVKRIYAKLNLVLKSAYKRVDGHCKCGEETSCYGCLRSYGNQLEHEYMARGMAKEYLEWLLGS